MNRTEIGFFGELGWIWLLQDAVQPWCLPMLVRLVRLLIFATVLYLPACFAALSEELRRVNLNQSFDISLPFQSGTGTRWTLAAPQSFQVGSQVELPQQGAPGATANQKFTLTPTRPGDYLLIWKLMRPGSEPFKQYQLNVHVE
jgi:predicted secreted protein